MQRVSFYYLIRWGVASAACPDASTSFAALHPEAPALQMRHIIAGTCARTMAQAFIHPLDTAKTRLQVRPCALEATLRPAVR